jgi:hypothetical protein
VLDPNGEPVDDQAEELNGRSRGVLAASKTRPPRRMMADGKVSGRKLQLPDSVFERLQLRPIRKRSNSAAVAAEILDRNPPKLKITSEE